MKFYITDAFTETVFGGNPAGIVILNEGMDFPEEELMIKTAAELRYSETVFIKVLGDNVFHLRYFTPTDEVGLCGHATIAAFHTLSEEGFLDSELPCINRTMSGDLNVDINDEMVYMDMADPQLIKVITDIDMLNELYEALGIEYENIIVETTLGAESLIYPTIVSTGLPDIILPVKDHNTLSEISPDYDKLTSLSINYDVVGVHAFALPHKHENKVLHLKELLDFKSIFGDESHSDDTKLKTTAYCRNFAPLYEIYEEAATGTASGALTYYLKKVNVIDKNSKCSFIQGIEMNRPSNIVSIIETDGEGKSKIKIGGSAVILASGEINIE